MCLTLFKKKIARDSLLVSALEFALKFMCSSKYMPSSLKDGDETEGWNEANPEGNAERFSIYIFSIRKEANT